MGYLVIEQHPSKDSEGRAYYGFGDSTDRVFMKLVYRGYQKYELVGLTGPRGAAIPTAQTHAPIFHIKPWVGGAMVGAVMTTTCRKFRSEFKLATNGKKQAQKKRRRKVPLRRCGTRH